MSSLIIGTDDKGRPFGLPPDVLTHTMAILAKKQTGKALALDTPIPTPWGWKTMGELIVGDIVYDERGCPTRITSVTEPMYGHCCYQVSFSDGSTIIADAGHLWWVEEAQVRIAKSGRALLARKRVSLGRGATPSRQERPQCRAQLDGMAIHNTEEMAQTLRFKGLSNYSVPTAAPILGIESSLPIDPYVLGTWLGDGTSTSGYITNVDHEVFSEIEGAGYSLGEDVASTGRATMRVVRGLRPQLRALGVLGAKRIPKAYLRSSVTQRLSLLQGLMDTDGTASRSIAEFTTTLSALAEDVYELVASLGIKVTLREGRAKLYGRDTGPKYRLAFRPTLPVFRLPRKASRLRPLGLYSQRVFRRYVVSITPVRSVPVRCIRVESPSHLFLAGRSFIPTHNTYLGCVIAEEMLKAGLPFVALDPVGKWWGLRSTPDGKHPSRFPIVVLGGRHGDIPIERHMGDEVARAVVEENISCIIDLTLLSKTAWREFVRDFCQELLRINESPRHIFLEEAPEFIPQQPRPDMAPTYEAVERLVRLGGNFALGCTLLSQRPAITSKDVLSQIDTLVALRTVGPHDRKAVAGMFESLLEENQLDDLATFKKGIASLPNGTAWVWSPEKLGVFTKVRVRERETFHPDPNKQMPRNVVQARPDVSALTSRLAAVVAGSPAQTGSPAAQCKGHIERINSLEAGLAATEEAGINARDEAADWKEVAEQARGELQPIKEGLARLQRQLNGVENLRSGLIAILGDSVGTGGAVAAVDEEAIIAHVLAHLPAGGATVVQVTPPEALRKSFEQRVVDRVVADVGELTHRQREMLLWLDTHDPVTLNVLARELDGTTHWSGPVSKPWEADKGSLVQKGFISQSNKWLRSRLRDEIGERLANHPSADIEGVYQQVIYQLTQTRVEVITDARH